MDFINSLVVAPVAINLQGNADNQEATQAGVLHQLSIKIEQIQQTIIDQHKALMDRMDDFEYRLNLVETFVVAERSKQQQ